MELNPKHYFKKVCAKHPELMGERLRSNRGCIGCARESDLASRKRHPDRVKARQKDWYHSNKESRAVYNKEWRERNKEYVSERFKVYRAKHLEHKTSCLKMWREKNRDKVLATASTHQVIRKRLIGSQALARSYAKETAEFYRLRPEGYEVDHIVPLRGKDVTGLHVPWNLQYLTVSENRRKHNKWR